MTKDQPDDSKTRAFALGADGAKTPIDSDTIEIAFKDGRRIAIDLHRAINDSSIAILAGRAIASPEDVEPGSLAVRAGAGNVLHITLEGGQPIAAPAT